MSVTNGTFPGVRIVDMPDLGAVTDASSVVGEHAGSGRFTASALRAYATAALTSVPNVSDLRVLTSGAASVFVQGYYAPLDGGGGYYTRGAAGTDNGGTIIVSPGGTYHLQTFGNPVSLTQFGARTSNTDNTNFIQPWLDALSASGLVGYVPPGVFNFATERTIHPNTRILGAGRAVAILRGTTANMTMLSLFNTNPVNTSIHLGEFSFDGGADGITGLATKNAWSMRVERVDFTGTAWTVKAEASYFAVIKDINVRGNADRACGQLLLHNNTGISSASSYNTVENYFVDCAGVWGMGQPGKQMQPLIKVDNTEATTLINCQGLSLDQPTANAIAHIEITGLSQGIQIIGGNSIGASVGVLLTQGPAGGLSYISIRGYQCDTFGTAGILASGTVAYPISYLDISGGFITAPQTNTAPCIEISRVGAGTIITGVVCQQWLSSPPPPSGVGIQIDNSDFVTVAGCSFHQLDKAIIVQGSSGRVTVTGNSFAVCNSKITDTSDRPAGHIFWPNNFTEIPAPVVVPPLPVSGVAVLNDTGYPLMIYVSGGTVTSIRINASITGLTSGSFYLSPGDENSITVNYTAAPDWQISVVP